MLSTTQNEGMITVNIVTMGRDTKVVAVKQGSTVEDAFREAGIAIGSKEVYCGSTKAEPHFLCQNGDVYTTIESKVEGGTK